MDIEFLTFTDIEIGKPKFHYPKSPISICDVDINKIVVSDKVHFGKKGFKYFIGYKNDKKQTTVFNASKNESIQKKF